MLRPLGFSDMLRFVSNQKEPRTSPKANPPLAAMLEDRSLVIASLGVSVPSVPNPAAPPPSANLRGKRGDRHPIPPPLTQHRSPPFPPNPLGRSSSSLVPVPVKQAPSPEQSAQPPAPVQLAPSSVQPASIPSSSTFPPVSSPSSLSRSPQHRLNGLP